ncbi:UNVERIFIED_CONTAM: hypothetical protein H355_010290 [Colinus virginianus]|nr:hypothetical protein H355_010290 [Colinus virginianus]
MESPQRSPLAHVFRGTFVHSRLDVPMEILHGRLLGVDDGGTIVFLEQADQQEQLAKKWGFKTSDIRELTHHEFFMPGLVDTHIHAPQYLFAGTRVDLPLLQWLTTYTFPTEAKYKDSDFAEEVYTRVVRRTLKNGTTTACYFATIYTDTSLLLADIVDKFGQRAFVGKVCMDINDTVPQYKETTADSVQEMERFVRELLERQESKVALAPTVSNCTVYLVVPLIVLTVQYRDGRNSLVYSKQQVAHKLEMPGLMLLKNSPLFIFFLQSHISETEEELKIVGNMFPAYQNYTDLYDKNKLLTSKTVMAHACHLSEEELELFNLRGAAIAHCPASNFSLRSGILNIQNVLKHSVKVGLGTDVAGGYSASMLDAIRKTVIASNTLKINKVSEAELTLKEAFRLATLGGSQALGLDDVIGNFEVGKEFDALLINTKASDSPFDLFSADTFEDYLQKFLYLGDDRNISEVYVAGKQVVPFSSSV